MTGFDSLVTRALADASFAHALVERPEETLREAGVEPTLDVVSVLKGLDVAALQRLAKAFGEEKAAIG